MQCYSPAVDVLAVDVLWLSLDCITLLSLRRRVYTGIVSQFLSKNLALKKLPIAVETTLRYVLQVCARRETCAVSDS